MPELIDIAACLMAMLSLLIIHHTRKKRSFPYPPGPKGLPILGNIFDIPGTKQWFTYTRWAEIYESSIIHLNALGQDIVVVSDEKVAQAMLEQKSDVYSNRPRMPMLVETVEFGWNFGVINPNEKWRVCRREFDQRFRQAASRNFRPHESRMTAQLLGRLLATPDDFRRHIQYMVTSLFLDLGYGIEVEPVDDKYVAIATRCFEGLHKAGDQNPIDMIPWLRYVPSWLPGMRWKRQVDLWRSGSLAMRDTPYEVLKTSLANGTARVCIGTDLLSSIEEDHDDFAAKEDIFKSVCASVFAGGSDTTVHTLTSFVLMMMLFPDIQQKARKEIDQVVGASRLPDFSDMDQLPYLTAILKEVLRWVTITPIGFPHSAAEDDIFGGYYIPKNSLVLMNCWAMLHDPAVYPEPEQFIPERFLTPDGRLDPTVRSPDSQFGYGKRICPGRFILMDTAWIVAACLLACFSFKKPEGVDMELSTDLFAGGLITHPLPFKCIITPRSASAVELIRSSLFSLES